MMSNKLKFNDKLIKLGDVTLDILDRILHVSFRRLEDYWDEELKDKVGPHLEYEVNECFDPLLETLDNLKILENDQVMEKQLDITLKTIGHEAEEEMCFSYLQIESSGFTYESFKKFIIVHLKMIRKYHAKFYYIKRVIKKLVWHSSIPVTLRLLDPTMYCRWMIDIIENNR